MKPSIRVRKRAVVDKRWSARFSLGWMLMTSLPVLVFGVWMLVDVDELSRKLIFVPMVVHGFVGTTVGIRPWINRRGFLFSGGMWLLSWSIGSLDHWKISSLEFAMIGFVAVLIWTQSRAYFRMLGEHRLHTSILLEEKPLQQEKEG